MKKNLYLLSLSVILFTACSKKDKTTPPPTTTPPTGTAVSAAVVKQLSATDSLSSFNGAYKATTLTDQDVSGGITIFAPANIAFGGNASTGELLPDSSLLKDYIVKGLLKAADLTANKTLTTLSGKTLTVTVSGSTVQVNGMTINTSSAFTGDGFIIYSAAKLLNAAATLSFTVWDATQWSASQPKGALAAGATVTLYNSQTDYALNKVVYTTQTNSNGVATFNGIKAGNYYVVASKGAINNVFNAFSELVDGAFYGYAADTIIDNQGNIIWKDLNQDGKVDPHDMSAVPAMQAQAAKTTSTGGTILMGYVIKPFQSLTEAQSALTGVYAAYFTTYSNLLAIDGVLSDDADCSAQTSFCPFDNFSITPLTTQLQSVVLGAYAQFGQLNRIINDVPNLNIAADQKADLIAQARGLRGYIYLHMMTYFGDLPIQRDLQPFLYPGITRSTSTDVFNYIITDLTAAAGDLPATRTDGRLALTKDAVLAFTAKAYLWKKDYSTMASYTNQLISSNHYTLATFNSWFSLAASSETIWAPSFSTVGSTLGWYYNGVFPSVTVQVCPVLRYSQVLLMDAECRINLGDYSIAASDLNALLTRRGQPTVSFTNTADGMTALQSVWQTENLRQGDRFANLVRWGMASSVLGANGFVPGKSGLLPIPQLLLLQYPGLNQNAGY